MVTGAENRRSGPQGPRGRAGRNKILPAVAPFALLLSGVASLISSCGIPTIPYIAPPLKVGQSTPNNNESTFYHDYTNNTGDNFAGYELYYKIYNSTVANSEASDTDQLNATEIPGITLLTSLGYLRVVSDAQLPASSSSKPLIPISGSESTQSVQVVVNFNVNIGQTSPDATWNDLNSGASGILRRYNTYVSGTTSTPKGFLSGDYASTDTDIQQFGTQYTSSSTPADLVVDIYVLGYGFDISSGSELYSIPIFLGRFTVQ